MKYSILNIKNNLYERAYSYVAIIIFILFCFVSFYISFGISQNYIMLLEDENVSVQETSVSIDLSECSKSCTVDMLQSFFSNLKPSTLTHISSIASYVDFGGENIDCPYNFYDDSIQYSAVYKENMVKNNMLTEGRYFTEEEYKQGKKVAIIPDIQLFGNIYNYDETTNTALLNNEIYEVIGQSNFRLEIPITSIEETDSIIDIWIDLDCKIKKEIYEDLKKTAEKELIGFQIEEISFESESNIRFYKRTVIQQIIILISLILGLSIILIWNLISDKYKISTYYICGLSKKRIYLIMQRQWMLQIVVLGFVAFLLVYFVIKSKLADMYVFIGDILNITNCLIIFAFLNVVMYLLGFVCIKRFIKRLC